MYTDDTLIRYGFRPVFKETVHKGPFPAPAAVKYLVMHHTAGVDSINYGVQNDRQVSYHLLISDAQSKGTFQIYQYARIFLDRCNHVGNSLIEIPDRNPNTVSIGIEVEGPPFADIQLRIAGRVAAAVLMEGYRRGLDLTLMRHGDMDDEKYDPSFHWTSFVRYVYACIPFSNSQPWGAWPTGWL